MIALTLFAGVTFASCEKNNRTGADKILYDWSKKYHAGAFGIVDRNDPFVELEIELYGKIRLELFPNVAPISVENFVTYVEEGFYDGVVFHRVIKGFMIQAGGFTEQDGQGIYKTPTHPMIQGEFSSNGVRNELKHRKGVLSMARSDDPNSGSSQFFICTAASSDLDGKYAAFGRVIDEESMAVALSIEKVETHNTYLYHGSIPQSSKDVPTAFPVIKKATLVQIGKTHLEENK